MIRHIVAYRLVAEAPAGKAEAIGQLKSVLEALPAVIPHVLTLVVAPDLGSVDTHWDAVLVSEHTDEAELVAYQRHPAHEEALQRINPLVDARAVVDYAMTDPSV